MAIDCTGMVSGFLDERPGGITPVEAVKELMKLGMVAAFGPGKVTITEHEVIYSNPDWDCTTVTCRVIRRGGEYTRAIEVPHEHGWQLAVMSALRFAANPLKI